MNSSKISYPKDHKGPFILLANGKNNNITGEVIMKFSNYIRKLQVQLKDLQVIGKNSLHTEFHSAAAGNSTIITL